MEKQLNIGSKVRIDSRHWIRANALAEIINFDGKRGDNHWLVCFNEAKVGGGFADDDHDSGTLLWCSDYELTPENSGKRKVQS